MIGHGKIFHTKTKGLTKGLKVQSMQDDLVWN